MRTKHLLSESSSLFSQFQPLRAAHPTYGLFILNRPGMHDYIHPNHPEGEVKTAEGEYLMYRSYPGFITKHLNLAKSVSKSLTESWMDSRRHPPSANDPLTDWHYLLNQKLGQGSARHRHALVFGLRTLKNTNRSRIPWSSEYSLG